MRAPTSNPQIVLNTSKGIVAAQDQYKPCSKLVQEIDIQDCTRLRRNDNVTNVIHWDLLGKCGFADRKNVKIKVLQVLRRCAGEESRLH